MAALPPHIIDTKWLGERPIHLDLPLPAAAVSEQLGAVHEFRPTADGRVALDVVREATSTVAVRGRLSAELAASCSRCLEPVACSVDCRVAHRLVAAGDDARLPLRAQAAPTDDDGVEMVGQMVVRPLAGRHLDLRELVLEDLVLALPMRALCRESCRGLCGSCGARVGVEACACAAAPAAARPLSVRSES